MIKHIVMFKVKEIDKQGQTKLLKTKLDELPGLIDVIQSFETGINFVESERAYDLALISEFKDEKDLEAYRVHPDHQKVVSFIKEVCEATKVVDYIC